MKSARPEVSLACHETSCSRHKLVLLAALVLLPLVYLFYNNDNLLLGLTNKDHLVGMTKILTAAAAAAEAAADVFHTTPCTIPGQFPCPSFPVSKEFMALNIGENTLLPNEGVSLLPGTAFGSASLDMFKGKWIFKPHAPGIAPQTGNATAYSVTSHIPVCNFTTRYVGRRERVSNFYSAPGLRAFNATDFVRGLERLGRPIVFVGDSVTYQMYSALTHTLKSELGPEASKLVLFEQAHYPLKLPDYLNEVIEQRPLTLMQHMKGGNLPYWNEGWIDVAISSNASFVVFNTGAWWGRVTHLWRGDWCQWKDWQTVDMNELSSIFEHVFESSLRPKLEKLRAHGIVPIWRDVSPAGRYDTADGRIMTTGVYAKYDYWQAFPAYNKIGRRLFSSIGGLVLPIWDLSFPRWEEHVLQDAKSGDALHWCNHYGSQAVPMVWNQMLYNVIFDSLVSGALSLPPLVQTDLTHRKATHHHQLVAPHLQKSSRASLQLNGSSCPCNYANTSLNRWFPEASAILCCRANNLCSWSDDQDVCFLRNLK